MEKNIFEGAKFGDMFVTRDGKIAIYMFNKDGLYLLVPKGYYSFNAYRSNGKEIEDEEHNLDIISRYQEPIDEAKLDELAYNKTNENVGENRYEETDLKRWYGFRDGFKAGYRKAKEE